MKDSDIIQITKQLRTITFALKTCNILNKDVAELSTKCSHTTIRLDEEDHGSSEYSSDCEI